MDYGTCFIGALRNDVAGVCKILELPPGIYPLYGLCVGAPATDPGQRPRLPLNTIWTKDRIPSDAQTLQSIDQADQASSTYYTARNQPTPHLVRRHPPPLQAPPTRVPTYGLPAPRWQN